NDPHLARSAADEFAAEVWRRRRDYLPELTPVADAARQAHALCGEGLVVLSDSADATTSGAPGDSTHVLAELLKYDWPRPVLVTLVAPEAVALARQHGPGAALTLSLGGRRDARFSKPLTLAVEVSLLFD